MLEAQLAEDENETLVDYASGSKWSSVYNAPW